MTNKRSSSWKDAQEELRASVRNLLLDATSSNAGKMERKNSLRQMDVPGSPVPERKLCTCVPLRGPSIVFNQQDHGMGEKEKFVTVVLKQPSDQPPQSWGFSFNEIEHHLVITRIAPDGLMDQQTDLLEVGDILWCINDHDCHSMSQTNVGELFKDCTSTISIRVKKPTLAQRTYVQAKLCKTTKGDSWGFTLGRSTDSSQSLMVKKTMPGGLAATQSQLRPGYEILAIDGINTTHGMSIEEAGRRLRKEEISIRARKPTYTPGTLLEVAIAKGTNETELGMVIRADIDGKCCILNIEHDTAAYHTLLEPGMILERIDDTPVRKMEPGTIDHFMKDAPKGQWSIKVRVP